MIKLTPFYDRATQLIELGFKVFPVAVNRKNPATYKGFYDASTDEEVIFEWSNLNPQFNVGVSMHESDLIVIDVDGKKNPWLEEHRNLFEESELIAVTPNGFHFYFQTPDPNLWKPSVGVLAPNVDVRAGPSYVVAPTSYVEANEKELAKGKVSGTYTWWHDAA